MTLYTTDEAAERLTVPYRHSTESRVPLPSVATNAGTATR